MGQRAECPVCGNKFGIEETNRTVAAEMAMLDKFALAALTGYVAGAAYRTWRPSSAPKEIWAIAVDMVEARDKLIIGRLAAEDEVSDDEVNRRTQGEPRSEP